jgi:hypothetical protein
VNDFSFPDLFVRFAYNFVTAFILIRLIYFQKDRRREFQFTFFIFNLMIFFVCSFLKIVQMNIGFAFGLFAIFTVLRYRTETIPIREMTYQFLVITIGALNGLASPGTWHPELLLINLVVCLFVFILDSTIIAKEELSQFVRYEKIELIKPGKRSELIDDLRERTGLDVYRIKIERINFMRDTADIIVYYKSPPGE